MVKSEKVKLSPNDVKVSLRVFKDSWMITSKLLGWNHFETLFIAFSGVMTKTNHYIIVETVNVLLVDLFGELVGRRLANKAVLNLAEWFDLLVNQSIA